MVAREFRSGKLIRLWKDELRARRRPPFDIGPDSLFVAYSASGDLGCFLVLGWPLPVYVLDLYYEFTALTNGRPPEVGTGLLGALVMFGLPAMALEEKEVMRRQAMDGGGETLAEQQALMDYCQEDTDSLVRLLPRILPYLDRTGRVLLRDRYSKAEAHIEANGVPLDVPLWLTLSRIWPDMWSRLVERVDRDYGVFEGTVFKAVRFAAYLERMGISHWPRTPKSKRLARDKDTMKTQASLHPELLPLKELLATQGKLRVVGLTIGADGRNRVPLNPLGTVTGRNMPSPTTFIYGPAVWMRGLIKPEPSMALAYLDWKAAEVGIAAALSGDPTMQQDYQKDPYLEFAKFINYVPQTAIKQTHSHERELFKTVVLATNYGQTAWSLAGQLGVTESCAEGILEAHAHKYPVYKRWADGAVSGSFIARQIETVLGWRMLCDARTNWRAIRNFPLQANCAEILRLACCLMTERGIRVCAPVHDAVLVEGEIGNIDAVIHEATQAMAEASRTVLGGFELRVGGGDKPILYPARYEDPRGVDMWRTVMNLVSELEMEGYGRYSETSNQRSA
jgi:hypothetical protein